MKRVSRRLLSILLAAAMVFGLSGMTAFAAEPDGEEPATIADTGEYNVKYAVTIWGINQDADENGRTIGLTFGPATGADYRNTYTAHLSKEEVENGGVCLHWMSWEEIARQSRIDPTAFQACLENGCTHSVNLMLNDDLLDTSYAGQMDDGDGAGMLRYSIQEKRRYWNMEKTSTWGYPGSQVRAVLVGKDDLSKSTPTNMLDGDNCLFSCFPEELKQEIVAKEVDSYSSYLMSDSDSQIVYDKLWLFSGKEMYAESGTTYDPVIRSLEGNLYQRSVLLGITTGFDDHEALRNWSEDGARSMWWTRTMARSNNTQVYAVIGNAVPTYYDTNSTSCGLAPGFCLPGPADMTELIAAITAAEALNEADYTADSWAALTEALDAAYAVRDTEGARQSEVDDATSALQDAMNSLKPLNAAAFAVFSADDDSLTFYEDADGPLPAAGGTYHDKTATTVYTGVESISATGTGDIPWYGIREDVTSVVIDPSFAQAQPVSLAYWFNEFENAAFSGFENVDTSRVTSLRRTFSYCSALTSLDLSGWDTSQVTSTSSMFYDCPSLTSVGDLSGWNTSADTTLYGMFYNCSALTGLNLSGWDTSQVTSMQYAFRDCSKLTSLGDLSGWNTAQMTTLQQAFYNCKSLAGIDVSGWNTAKVTDMSYTFGNCSSLTSLDISGWDTSGVTYNPNFATGCSALEWVKIGEKTNIFTLQKCVTQQNWYSSDTKGTLVSSNYLQDVTAPGQYWTYTEHLADKSKLQSEYDADSKLSESDYTASSWSSFAKALANAKEVLDDANPTQDEVDAALSALQTAKDGLKKKSGDSGSGGTTSSPTVKKDSDGKWYYYDKNGKKDLSYTGFASNSNGKWYVKNGVVDFSVNDVLKDTTGSIGSKGTWWYVVGSKVQSSFTGLANYKNANGWWYIKNGAVDFTHNGVDKNVNGWYYVTGGKVQFGFTGLANYKNENGWWYIKSGKVDFSHNGVDKNVNGWYYVEGGKVNFGYTGVSNYKNAYGWWYIKNGKVDFGFTGTASNKYGTWNVRNGKVQF